MRRLALVAAAIATTLLAACGGSGSTKTVTVAGSAASGTSSAAPSTTPSTSNAGATAKASDVAACFQAGGAAVSGPNPAGRGQAVHAITRDSAAIGFLEGPTSAIAFNIASVFASKGGWKIKPIKTNPQGFAIYKGTLTSADSALLTKCTT